MLKFDIKNFYIKMDQILASIKLLCDDDVHRIAHAFKVEAESRLKAKQESDETKYTAVWNQLMPDCSKSGNVKVQWVSTQSVMLNFTPNFKILKASPSLKSFKIALSQNNPHSYELYMDLNGVETCTSDMDLIFMYRGNGEKMLHPYDINIGPCDKFMPHELLSTEWMNHLLRNYATIYSEFMKAINK